MTDHICQSRTCTNPIPKRDSESWPAWAKRKYCCPQHARDEAKLQAEENPMPKYPHKPASFNIGIPVLPQAACKGHDPEMWHPTNSNQDAEAKRICREECPHLADCLEFAITNREYGIWAGTTDEERDRMRRQRRRAAA